MDMNRDKMRLVGVWSPPGAHAAGWRMPEAPQGDSYSFKKLKKVAQLLEEAKLDAMFFADSSVMQIAPQIEAGDRAGEAFTRILKLESFAMISALSAVTERLGFIATATTTYNEPYALARRLASIDQISEGRAGWNLVTSQHEMEAQNFNKDEHMEHDLRYERAEEFFNVCAGLWDGWEEGALVEDKATGRYSDISKFHVLNHKGKHFQVRGPLNVPRSPQGRPIIAQAGASGPGRQLAARISDVIFLASSELEDCKAFTDDVRARAVALGRPANAFRAMPGFTPIIGRTEEEAREHYEMLNSLVTDEQGISALRRIAGGLDLWKYPLDGPLPDLPPTNGPQARQQIVKNWVKKNPSMTLRDVARRFAASDGHNQVYGTPSQIADIMEEWFRKGACDGFCVIFPYYLRGITDFTTLVVPELQRRGLFRTEYEGRTLRENLGLEEPASIFA